VLITTLGFVALTALVVFWHVRSSRRAPAACAPMPCPRCRGPVPRGVDFCPGCGAPMQAFELVTAPIAKTENGSGEGPKHAIVRADLCVGCGTCVAVCPEPGAIFLVDKVARVDLDRCKGHGQCATACPIGAILVTSGAAVQRLEVPDLTPNFETNVPGLYVVGELGGRGLIKNAVNEGKLAVEHVARSLGRRPGARPAVDGVADVLIVGSGPAGLSAGLEAVRQGLSYRVLEQGTLADSIAKYPRKKLLLAEPLRVPLYGDLWVSDASKEELLQVWQNLIARSGLRVTTGQRATEVARENGTFRVQTTDRSFQARRVVLAMGRRGTPRRLGVPGEELDKVFYDIIEMEAFAGQRLLVVGGGDSAVESAVGLAHQPGTHVTLSYRGERFERVKPRNREKLDALAQAGRIDVLLGSQVREIKRGEVALDHQGTVRLLHNDTVIVRIGGEASYPFLQRIGVRIVPKEIPFEPQAAQVAG
jgi:putative YpdA family bacillithiol system oxidoreductase